MVNENFLLNMISYAAIKRSDEILEIGAGFGFLTRHLAQKAKKVIAVEIDPKLVKILQSELKDFRNIKLIQGDILNTSIPPFNKVVCNPPFSISSPLLFQLLNINFNCSVLTLQYEFAARLGANVGTKDYSRLTVSTYYRAEVELLDFVPKTSFYPSPDVDANIVRLRPRNQPPFNVKDEKLFNNLVRTLFTQRNRKIRNAIRPLLQKLGFKDEKALKQIDHLSFHNKRVRELAPEDFGVLANELSS
jgi:16S rRNA (adenine1518-N6/adenine1519-N6)-dimethyltransferase